MQTHTDDTTPQTRIYAQLKPLERLIPLFTAVQQILPRQTQGRMIGEDELHLTLIHFGKADDVFESVRGRADICRERFDEHLAAYVTRTTALLPTGPIELPFDSIELFGPKRTSLVASFRPSEALNAVHSKLFGVLVAFLTDIGIADPLRFMADDSNFRHASVCRPHVTLYKGFSGSLPSGSLPSVSFTAMDVAY